MRRVTTRVLIFMFLFVAMLFCRAQLDNPVTDASTLNGQTAGYYLSRANHTGTQDGSTITGGLTNAVELPFGVMVSWGGTNCQFGFLSATQAVMRFDMGGGNLSNTLFNAVSD